MRILGVSKKWDKLQHNEFTTFRFARKDKDWQVSEVVQIVYKPRSKEREILGVAKIISKKLRRIFKSKALYHIPIVTKREAIRDGFMGWGDMALWLTKAYGHQQLVEKPMNKLTLAWIDKEMLGGK